MTRTSHRGSRANCPGRAPIGIPGRAAAASQISTGHRSTADGREATDHGTEPALAPVVRLRPGRPRPRAVTILLGQVLSYLRLEPSGETRPVDPRSFPFDWALVDQPHVDQRPIDRALDAHPSATGRPRPVPPSPSIVRMPDDAA